MEILKVDSAQAGRSGILRQSVWNDGYKVNRSEHSEPKIV